MTYLRTSVEDEPVEVRVGLEGFDTWYAELDSVIGLDVETVATDDARGMFSPDFAVRLVQFGTEDVAYVLRPDVLDERYAIERALNSDLKFVTHSSYDVMAVWHEFGIALGQRVVDTYLLALLLDPGELQQHDLKYLSDEYIDEGLSQAQETLDAKFRILAREAGVRGLRAGQRYGWNNIDIADTDYLLYAGLDAIYVRRLLDRLLRECEAFPALAVQENWLQAQTIAMTLRGVKLDRDYAQGLLDTLGVEHDTLKESLIERFGFPALSPKRAEWLVERGVKLTEKTETGRWSLTKDVIAGLRDVYTEGEVGLTLREMTRLAELSNLVSNVKGFIESADDNDRVHPTIKTMGAKTGRMSVTKPALQTIKKTDKRLRDCFIADEGMSLISVDFAQVEIRVAAALSRDETLTDIILSGEDVHSATARLIFGDDEPAHRKIAKTATLGSLYGSGAANLARQTGISEDRAHEIVDTWRSTYKGLDEYRQQVSELDVVVNAAGRRIPADPDRAYANLNYMIQSTARDLFVAAVYRVVTQLGLGAALWLFIHDELVLQVPSDRAQELGEEVRQTMETVLYGVPIEAELEVLGQRWAGTA